MVLIGPYVHGGEAKLQHPEFHEKSWSPVDFFVFFLGDTVILLILFIISLRWSWLTGHPHCHILVSLTKSTFGTYLPRILDTK